MRGEDSMPGHRFGKDGWFNRGRTLAHWLPVLGLIASSANADSFMTFDGPSATYTVPLSINNTGFVCGYFRDDNGTHAFIRAPDGTITPFDVGHGNSTGASSINNSNEIAGSFQEARHPGLNRGFVRAADGTVTIIHPPRSDNTFASGINDAGDVVGGAELRPYGIRKRVEEGFIRSASGNLTLFELPKSKSKRSVGGVAINNSDVVAGYGTNEKFFNFAFMRTPDGAVTFIAPHRSDATEALAINDSNQVAGFRKDESGFAHAFLVDADGKVTQFDPPTAIATFAYGINAAGDVSGYYADDGDERHGFVRSASGEFTSFDVPGQSYNYVLANAINNNGLVTGYFIDDAGAHGFIRTP
jgi:uncharacterized membrane protein